MTAGARIGISMKKSHLIGICLGVIILTSFVFPEVKLKQIQQIDGDVVFGGEHFDSVVDLDGDLISGFAIPGVVMVNENGMKELFPFGQGPGDVDGWYMLYILGTGELVVEGAAGKLKVFEKKDGTYKWKKTLWKQRWKKGHKSKDGLMYDKKWFLTDTESDYRRGDKEYKLYHMRIYSDEGKFLKRILPEVLPEPRRFHLLQSSVCQYKGKIYFLIEHRMAVDVIDPTKLEPERRVLLETPTFYKPMPNDFFRYKKNPQVGPISVKDFRAEMTKLRSGYSRITAAEIVNDYLIVQLRTCRKDMKHYVLLFYDAATFKLKQTIPTDDFLMASQEDKLYFFKGGHPTYEEVEDTAFVIYRVVQE
jgi:hypothetical protein